MKAIYLFITLSICIFSCTTGELMSNLRPGMTKQEVTGILGQPDGYSSQDGYEVYKYTNKLVSGWSYDRADYNIIFLDDKVKEYGAGQVRTKQSGVNTILFLAPLN